MNAGGKTVESGLVVGEGADSVFAAVVSFTVVKGDLSIIGGCDVG